MSKKHIFTPLEKKVLLDGLLKYKNIIENKNTDGASLRQKHCAWEKISSEYNASPHCLCQVSTKQLKRLWMNLKQRQREALTKERQHRMATGGGPTTSDAVISPEVSILAPALIMGIDEAIDSDTLSGFETNTPKKDAISDVVYTLTQPQPSANSLSGSNYSPSSITLSIPSTQTTETFTLTQDTETPTITYHPVNPLLPTDPVAVPSSITNEPMVTATRPPRPTSVPFQQFKNIILEKEYTDRLKRAEEEHKLNLQLLNYKVREAKAKAEQAELILGQLRTSDLLSYNPTQE